MHSTFHPSQKNILQHLPGIDICIYPVALVGDEMTEQLKISPRDRVRLRQIKHPHKIIEFLASRLALSSLNPKYRITYEGRIPSLDNGKHISITHAHNVAAAAMSENYIVGIDVEAERQQLFKISDKFLHPEEKMMIRPDRVLADLHVYWGAKEALFKIWKYGEVDFSHEFRVAPFAAKDSGETTATILKGGLEIHCNIHFQKMNNYYMVVAWTEKQSPMKNLLA